MNTVNASYSFVFQCDSRTALSIGLSLLVTIATAVALGILAHYEYINSTTAYATAPALGTVLMMIGLAITLIRKDTSSDLTEKVIEQSPVDLTDPTEIHKELDRAKTLNLKAYSERPSGPVYIKHVESSQNAPYHSIKIQVEIKKCYIEVELIAFATPGSNKKRVFFQWEDKFYKKYLDISADSYWGICEQIEKLHEKNLFFYPDYVKRSDPTGPVALFIDSIANENKEATLISQASCDLF